jgi:hypothetical protein
LNILTAEYRSLRALVFSFVIGASCVGRDDPAAALPVPAGFFQWSSTPQLNTLKMLVQGDGP